MRCPGTGKIILEFFLWSSWAHLQFLTGCWAKFRTHDSKFVRLYIHCNFFKGLDFFNIAKRKQKGLSSSMLLATISSRPQDVFNIWFFLFAICPRYSGWFGWSSIIRLNNCNIHQQDRVSQSSKMFTSLLFIKNFECVLPNQYKIKLTTSNLRRWDRKSYLRRSWLLSEKPVRSSWYIFCKPYCHKSFVMASKCSVALLKYHYLYADLCFLRCSEVYILRTKCHFGTCLANVLLFLFFAY